MVCHYVKDPDTGEKILIPGCYGSLHQEDKSCCTCYSHKQFKKDIKPVRDAQHALVNNADKDQLRDHLIALMNLYQKLEQRIIEAEK
tara:strand:+ start:6087 stop:6347 length:261 start_codon:yes stop_codon:yes gene_type:complete